MKKINFKSKFQKFDEHWSPKVIAEMNDYQFKLVKIERDFIWHQHDETDEVFIVIEGKIFIEFKDEIVEISEGEMIVVPKGVKHKPYAEEEAKIMLIEPTGTVNTGDIEDKLTAPNDNGFKKRFFQTKLLFSFHTLFSNFKLWWISWILQSTIIRY